MVIRGIASVPGCEGRTYHLGESIAVFGLGFHGSATLCVLDLLEADKVYLFLATPGSRAEYVTKVREMNLELSQHHKVESPIQEMSLSSVESCYRQLASMVGSHRAKDDITLIPMGPKPHVLASILTSMRFAEVSCLRVSGAIGAADVTPTGESVATRVTWTGEA
jgi:hypothetical protein